MRRRFKTTRLLHITYGRCCYFSRAKTAQDQRQHAKEFVETMIARALLRLKARECIAATQSDAAENVFSEVTKKPVLQLAPSLLLQTFCSTTLGDIAARFYVTTRTVAGFHKELQKPGPERGRLTWIKLLKLLCDAPEYDELPVRYVFHLLFLN